MGLFKIGDIVKLKSGGPDMTVSETYNNDYVKTIWFSENQLNYGEFHEQTLEIPKKV